MNIFRTSMLVITDYELKNIKKIETEIYKEKFFYNLSCPKMIKSKDEYLYSILAYVNDDKNIVKWCNKIYKEYIPLNITILDIGEADKTYIKHQWN